jgi:hypothetical protein
MANLFFNFKQTFSYQIGTNEIISPLNVMIITFAICKGSRKRLIHQRGNVGCRSIVVYACNRSSPRTNDGNSLV